MHLQHDSQPFLPLEWRFTAFWLVYAQKSSRWPTSLGFSIFGIFFSLSFFSFSFLFAAVINLLLGLLLLKKTSKKASLRWAIFTMEQLGLVAGNLALSFSLMFLSIFGHISGSIRPISLICASLERPFPPAEVEYRWCLFWPKVMTSEVEEMPRLVTAAYDRHRTHWINFDNKTKKQIRDIIRHVKTKCVHCSCSWNTIMRNNKNQWTNYNLGQKKLRHFSCIMYPPSP